MNSLVDHAALAACTIVAVSTTALPALPARPEGDFELAAHVMRVEDGRLKSTGDAAFVRIPPGRTSQAEREIIQRTGLSEADAAFLSPSVIAMAYLSMHLTNPPYILAVHQATEFANDIAWNHELVPELTKADIVDTADWALWRHEIPVGPLTSCAHVLQIHDGFDDLDVKARARLTAAVFTRLASDETVASLAEVIDQAGYPPFIDQAGYPELFRALAP